MESRREKRLMEEDAVRQGRRREMRVVDYPSYKHKYWWTSDKREVLSGGGGAREGFGVKTTVRNGNRGTRR